MQPSTKRVAVQMLNKVPEVTVFFWIIKICATTVGETAADFLNETMKLGLTKTSIVMSVLTVVVLFFQFRSRKYTPGIYWLAVVMISVVGTLVSDNLVDNLGVSLKVTTALFAVALTIAFSVWYASEHTLSIHTIHTTKREAFYWSAILFAFALGTSAGDLVAESLNVGYWKSAILFGAMIAVIGLAYRYLKLNAVLAFWAAYILTRPLGASIGDFMSQPRSAGGLALGTTGTSAIMLSIILVLVIYLTVTRVDETPEQVEATLIAREDAARAAEEQADAKRLLKESAAATKRAAELSEGPGAP